MSAPMLYFLDVSCVVVLVLVLVLVVVLLLEMLLLSLQNVDAKSYLHLLQASPYAFHPPLTSELVLSFFCSQPLPPSLKSHFSILFGSAELVALEIFIYTLSYVCQTIF